MRALLIDDYEPFLSALTGYLGRFPSVEVVGAATSGDEGLKLADELVPDVVLLDYSMYGTNGIDVVQRLKAKARPPRVIMVSLHAEPEYRNQALQAGADDYVVKTDICDQLITLLEHLKSMPASRQRPIPS